jgi:hypothetical protein
MYLNENWTEKDGGELLLYDAPPNHDTEKWRVAPQMGSVILFFSDYRVPHQVLPACKDRYSITTWYYDKKERSGALERAKNNPEEINEKQRKKVEEEMRSFEQRTGSAVNEKVEGSYRAKKASEYPQQVNNTGVVVEEGEQMDIADTVSGVGDGGGGGGGGTSPGDAQA